MISAIRVLALALILSLALPGVRLLAPSPTEPYPAAAEAQTADAAAPDYAEWEKVAIRAEEAIAGKAASDAAYEGLRAELTTWRSLFDAAQNSNAERIATVRNQIAALGPPPEEGQVEAEEVAARRAELKRQLDELRAPVVRAEEAFQRAGGLIREIDQLLADRRAEKLLTRSVSPLNPANWPPALARLSRSWVTLKGEVGNNYEKLSASGSLDNDLPLRIALLLAGLAMIFRGRVWSARLAERARQRFRTELPALLISFGQVVLPTLGVYALVWVAGQSELPGLRLGAIIGALPLLVLAVTLAIWVGERLFPETGTPLVLAGAAPSARLRARRLAVLAAIVFGLQTALSSLAEAVDYDLDIAAVAYFPGLLLEGVILFLLGLTLHRAVPRAGEGGLTGGFQGSSVLIVARALMAVGLAAPLAAAAGYTNLALRSVFPAGESLLLLGILVIVHRLSLELHRLLAGGSLEDSQNSLVPVLFTALVALASLPVFALIWGTRPATLTEYWARLSTGFQIGDTRIQPSDFLTFVVVFAVGYMMTRIVQNALRSTVLPKTRIDPGGRNAIVAGVGYVGIFLAALVAVSTAGIDLSSLAIVAGALSVGIGFGLQNIVSNFVSGIILLVERPVAEGDWIEVAGHQGYVRDISVRATRIETFDRQDVIVPNSELVSGALVNYTRGNTIGRLVLPVGVAYGTDTGKVDAILREIAEAHPMVLDNPAPSVVFRGFGADSLDFEIRAILRDVNWGLSVRSELNHQINRRFVEEGIEIPFAQRDVWLRNPETLRAPADAPPTPPKPAGPLPPELQDRHGDTEPDDD